MKGIERIVSFLLLIGLAGTCIGQPLAQTAPSDGERVFVHTDKNFYLAGEIVWFKLYMLNDGARPTSMQSRVAYVEIIDRGGKPAVQGKIKIDGKSGSGSFYLPLSLSTDIYSLKAYTSWMKNEGEPAFFEKQINIVNTMKGREKIEADSVRMQAAFFPEGGQLVRNIESRVAFLITDAAGRGIAAEGVVVDEKGDTVTNFTTQRFGMGTFQLTPAPGRQYRALIKPGSGPGFIRSLPDASDRGYVMNVTDNGDGRWKIKVKGKGRTAGGQTGEEMLLTASSQNRLMHSVRGYVDYDDEWIAHIAKSVLEEGVSHFTLLNAQGQPVAERLVFTRPTSVGRAGMSVDDRTYPTRSAVNIATLLDTIPGTYSLAVYQLDSLSTGDPSDIVTYKWLGTELRGNIESPSYYFADEADAISAADNLMLTHGWRRFQTNNAASVVQPNGTMFPRESRGHQIMARVTAQDGGKAGIGVICYLSFQAKPYGFYTAKSDSMGIVRFDVSDYYGQGDVIIQAEQANGIAYRADPLTPFWGRYPVQHLPSLNLEKSIEKSLATRSIAMQAQNIYDGDSIRRFQLPPYFDTLPFFGKAEYRYNLDEYKRFTTMEEVLREYVTPVSVLLTRGKLVLRVVDESRKIVYQENILAMIDGVPLRDFNKIFSYDPLKIKKIDVVPRRYLYGPATFAGIISAETYEGKFDAFELDPSLIAIDYEGLQMQREFYSPDYSVVDPQRRIPDFRSTLYWTPSINASKDGKSNIHFYTSDRKGNFLAILQGMDGKGRPVSASANFKVE